MSQTAGVIYNWMDNCLEILLRAIGIVLFILERFEFRLLIQFYDLFRVI